MNQPPSVAWSLTTTMETKNLPHRLRESSFRSYEIVIAKIVKYFPAQVVLTEVCKTTGLSPLTFSARLRDAKLSLLKFKWPTTIIDMKKFNEFHDQMVIAHTSDDNILAGSREAIKLSCSEPFTIDPSPATVLSQSPAYDATQLCRNDIWLLAELIHHRCIIRPMSVSLSESDAQELEDSYDVRADKQPDGLYILT